MVKALGLSAIKRVFLALLLVLPTLLDMGGGGGGGGEEQHQDGGPHTGDGDD